jgi:hypothetical protein
MHTMHTCVCVRIYQYRHAETQVSLSITWTKNMEKITFKILFSMFDTVVQRSYSFLEYSKLMWQSGF